MNGLGKFLFAAVCECQHMQKDDLEKLLEFLDAGTRRICEAHVERPSILDEPVDNANNTVSSTTALSPEETHVPQQQSPKLFFIIYIVTTAFVIIFVMCLWPQFDSYNIVPRSRLQA